MNTLHRRLAAIAGGVLWLVAIGIGPVIAASPPPGPPFPPPVDGQAVYDFAGVLSPEAIADAEATIDAIEERTGAEVVIYTQDARTYDLTTEGTEGKARALIDQWGIGRAGFNDGMVIFLDLDPSLEHGQVQLYAAPGFEAAFLTNAERQGIYENDMLPYLRAADFDGAVSVAMQRIDAAATAEHANQLQTARQVNAVVGLVGAPIAFLGLSGWAILSWRRFGKDPVYLDDPSILMPAPPHDLTAASGALVMDGHSSRRALTTAMLDLASRGLIAFREDKGFLSHKVEIDVDPPAGDATVEAQRRLNARTRTGPAEDVALAKLRSLGNSESDKVISSDRLPEFGTSVAAFDKALEGHVVKREWFAEAPSKVVSRWAGRGSLALIAGVIFVIAGIFITMSGLVLIGAATIAGSLVMLFLARSMPAVTTAGSMVRAMLHAYRRTLEKTMEQARSMQQVVDEIGPRLARDTGSGRRLGDGVGPPGPHRGGPQAQPGRREGRHGRGVVALLPRLVPELEWVVAGRVRDGRQRSQRLLGLGHPGSGRDDVRARDDRQLALVVRLRWRWRRLQRRRLRRRWGRRGRRFLGARFEFAPRPRPCLGGVRRPPVHSAHGCSRDDGRLLREAERR